MNITEKDIFDFVFNPSNLSKEKKSYITKNLNKFKDQIQYLKDLNDFSEFEDDEKKDTDFFSNGNSDSNFENYN